MISKELFLERYNDLHNRIIPNLLDSQEEDNLRKTKENQNSAIWTYWHMLRTEDVGVSRLILDRDQIYLDYAKDVNLDTTLNGTGMTNQEVELASSKINLESMIAYRFAIRDQTIELCNNGTFDLSAFNSDAFIDQVVCQEGIFPDSVWHLKQLYYKKTKEWFLLHVCLLHPFYHLGQATQQLK